MERLSQGLWAWQQGQTQMERARVCGCRGRSPNQFQNPVLASQVTISKNSPLARPHQGFILRAVNKLLSLQLQIDSSCIPTPTRINTCQAKVLTLGSPTPPSTCLLCPNPAANTQGPFQPCPQGAWPVTAHLLTQDKLLELGVICGDAGDQNQGYSRCHTGGQHTGWGRQKNTHPHRL